MSQLTLVFPKHAALLSPDEIYEKMDQELLSAFKEDRRLERKPAGTHFDALGDYFAMWANTLPEGGLLVVGMENDGSFSGCHKLSQNQLNEIEKCHQTFCPDARVESKRIPVAASDGNDSFVIVFRVRYREDKVVRTVSGRAFIRRGDSKHGLGESDIRELEIDKRQVDLEKEPIALQYPDDFDLGLISRFIEGVRRVHQLLSEDHRDTDYLVQRRLGVMRTGKFLPNTACALAFAKDPVSLFPGCQIKFLRVAGEYELSGRKYNIIKTISSKGPVPGLLERCAEVISSQRRDFSRLGDDGLFYCVPEYPYD